MRDSAAPRHERRGAPIVLGTVSLNGGDAALLEAEMSVIAAGLGAAAIVFDQQADVARRYLDDVDIRPALTQPPRRRRSRAWRRLTLLGRLARLRLAARAQRRGHLGLTHVLVRSATDRSAFAAYSDSVAAFTPGGTMLVEQYELLPRLVDWHIAMQLGCSLVVFTQSIGPFRRRLERRMGGAALRCAALVLVRGERSRDQVLALGVDPGRVEVSPDPAFLFAVAPPPTARRARGRVAISVRDWPHFRGADPDSGQHLYETAIAQLCEHLVGEHSVDVLFLSTCQGVPEYAFDDSRPANRIVSALSDATRSRVTVDAAHHRPIELRDLLGEFDLVVATRMHAAILALDAHTPAVAIAYEHKTWEVFERLDMADRVLDIETLDGNELCARVTAILGRGPTLTPGQIAAIDGERAAVEALGPRIRAALGSVGSHPA